MKKITKDNLVESFLQTIVKWKKGDEGVILSDVMRLFEANCYNESLKLSDSLQNKTQKQELSKNIDDIINVSNNKMKELNEC